MHDAKTRRDEGKPRRIEKRMAAGWVKPEPYHKTYSIEFFEASLRLFAPSRLAFTGAPLDAVEAPRGIAEAGDAAGAHSVGHREQDVAQGDAAELDVAAGGEAGARAAGEDDGKVDVGVAVAVGV